MGTTQWAVLQLSWLIVASATPALARVPDRSTVAVTRLQVPEGFTPELRRSIAASIAETLDELRAFKAQSVEEVEARLEQGRLIELLKGEVKDDAIAKLGEALDSAYLVTGAIVHREGQGEAALQLLQVDPPTSLARLSRTFEGPPEAALPAVRRLTRLLVRDLLAARSGWLEIVVSEEGATVRVNGKAVGSSPLIAPVSAPEGLNELEVERKGFVSHLEDVDIAPDQTTLVRVNLIPSVEFIEDYKASVSTRNVAGWSLVAAGVGAAVAAGVLYVEGAARASTLNDDIEAYNLQPQALRSAAEFDALRGREGDIATLDTLAVAGGALSLIALGTGVGLLVTAPPGNRYDTFLEARPQRGARLQLGWGALRVWGRF